MSGPIRHLLSDTVTYQRRDGVSTYGDPTWGSKDTAEGRWEQRTKYSADGSTRLCDDVFITVTEFQRGDRVWAPDSDTDEDTEAKLVRDVIKASTPGGGLTLYEVRL